MALKSQLSGGGNQPGNQSPKLKSQKSINGPFANPDAGYFSMQTAKP